MMFHFPSTHLDKTLLSHLKPLSLQSVVGADWVKVRVKLSSSFVASLTIRMGTDSPV